MNETYHHGNLRQELIKGGLKMLGRDGIEAFSLRKLSRELGVSHAAAYRHFPNREALLGAIFIESSTRFRDALAEAVPAGTEGKEALIQLGIGYVHFFLNNPEILTLFNLIPSEQNTIAAVFQGMDKESPAAREIGAHSNFCDIDTLPETSAFGIFRGIAAAAREEELYKNLSEREILLGFWAKVHGMAALLVTQKNFFPDDQVNDVIDRLMRVTF